MNNNKKNTTKERQVIGYLRPQTHEQFKRYLAISDMSESKIVNLAMKTFLETLSRDVKERIQSKNGY